MNLFTFYRVNFLMKHKFNFTLTELEDMIPFEREVYISLLDNYLEEQKAKNKGTL